MKNSKSISARSFLTSLLVIFLLMVVSYALTFIVPSGQYQRAVNESGQSLIVEGSYQSVEGGLPFWKWLLSPVLVLGASGSGTLIAVIAFLLVIGGIFAALEKCELMQYMVEKIADRFAATRYKLMAVLMFFFMAMGAMIGSFEEIVPLVPVVVALAVRLGWDVETGLSMSLLAAGCGFASGVCNPFTVGVAQKLAGLPMFSGIWLRAVSFVLIYSLLLWFVQRHAKLVEKPATVSLSGAFQQDAKKEKGMKLFAGILGAGIVLVLCSPFLTFLQDLTLIIVALMFLVAGVVSVLVAGLTVRELGKHFLKGAAGILPAVLMILMASSVKYILEESLTLDTILHASVALAETLPQWTIILFIYLIVLVMNFFVASGSAKAFMMIPLIVPMAQVFGLSSQLCVMAFAFGDGFSNVFYPTNAALLISLGLADEGYSKWFRYSWKFQVLNLALTSGILLLGLAVGY